jgi:hypothetical protein
MFRRDLDPVHYVVRQDHQHARDPNEPDGQINKRGHYDHRNADHPDDLGHPEERINQG